VEKFVREARTSGYGVLLEEQEEKKDDVSCYLAGASVEVLRVEPGSSVAGKTIGEADLRRKTGATVLGIRQGQDFTANPSTASRLDPGMVAVVFGTAEQVTRAAALFRDGSERQPEPEPQAAAADGM
jgi:K+/H+ antiporter YhaU regulatory subunit KhtT